MRKSFFYLPLAALALAACSSDDVVNNTKQISAVNGDQVSIVPVVTGNTRGTVVTTSNLNAFKVKIEGNFQKGKENATKWTDTDIQVITKAGSSWNFNAGVEYWWADKDTQGKFTAWSPAADDFDLSSGSTSITVGSDITTQKDYIVAYNEGKREDFETAVPLNFQHVMSQIVVKALNKDQSDIKVEVAGMKLVNIKNTNTLTAPAVKTNVTFDWSTYTPWAALPTGNATYAAYNTSESITQSTATTLTASATTLGEPMMLIPQQLVAQDMAAQNTTSMTNNYLAVLVKVTNVAVSGYRDADGHYYKAVASQETPTTYTMGDVIAFTAKRPGTTGENDTYTDTELTQLEKGQVPTQWLNAEGSTWTNTDKIYTAPEVRFPREGFGTTSEKYAYVGVPLDQEWKPGYKYTYTLTFSKDGIGKSIADQPADAATYNTSNPTYNFPFGYDMATGTAENPGEDIIDNPVQLFFTVTVDQWTDADAIDKNM